MKDKIESKFISLELFHVILDNKWYKPFLEDGTPNIARIEDMSTLEFYRGNLSFSQYEFDDAMKLVKLLLTKENEDARKI